jgi:hypothetical protein
MRLWLWLASPGMRRLCYDVGMRRVLALLLLVGFSLPLIAPAFASHPDEASLPACCRRNGEHHCAMSGMIQAGAAGRDRTVAPKCPFAPFAAVALMLPHPYATKAASAVSTPHAGPAAMVRDAEAGFRVSFDRTRQKRGPPSLLSL